MRISRFALVLAISLTALTLSSAAFAQEGRVDAVTKTLGSETVTMVKPEGWVVGAAPRGSAMLLRAAGDESSQIEVKFTPGVSADMATSFFASFHTQLRKAGMRKQGDDQKIDLGPLAKATLIEYALVSDSKPFRMIIVQAHRASGAYMIIGFFPEFSRDKHFESMKSFISSMVIKPSKKK